MKNCRAWIVMIVASLMLVPSSVCLVSTECFRDRNPDIVICPPPNGGIAADTRFNLVCGIGWCAADTRGRIKCSRVPGGAAIVDQNGKILCVGGCMEASPSLCQRIELPKITSR